VRGREGREEKGNSLNDIFCEGGGLDASLLMGGKKGVRGEEKGKGEGVF